MEELVYYLLTGAGMAILWWRHLRRANSVELESLVEEETRDVLHAAQENAVDEERPLSNRHLILALLENKDFGDTVRRAGGNPQAIEDQLRSSLADPPPDSGTAATIQEATETSLRRAIGIAIGHKRKATLTDLWAALARSDAAEDVKAGGTTAAKILFALVHGITEASAPLPYAGKAELVMVNDDYSSQDSVIEILRGVFELDDHAARRRMLATHQEGRVSLGSFSANDARRRIAKAHEIARANAEPLWVRWEPFKARN